MKVIGIMFLLLVPVIIGCGGESGHDFHRPVVKDVELSEVLPRIVPVYYDVSATVVPLNRSIVGAKVMGHVESLYVKEGDKVEKGQLLLTIEEGDALERLKAAKKTLEEAQRMLEIAKKKKELSDITYERYKSLFDENAIARQEMDEIETAREISDIEYKRAMDAFEKARANVEIAKINYGFTKVYSPSEGTVVNKRVDKGSLVVPGTPLLVIEDPSGYRVEFRIDERFLGKIKPGDRVKITINSLGKILEEEVSEVVSSVDPNTRTFLVKVNLPFMEGLRGGLYSTVSIPVGRKKSLLIPSSSVVRRGQLTGVYVVSDEGLVSYRLVKLGPTYGSDVIVLSGLRKGEKIIIRNTKHAIDGGIIERR